MKKIVLVTAGLLSLFTIIMKSNADMKITPSGVTSPDDAAAIHVSDDLSTGSSSHGPEGAAVSGVNTYSGDFITYGGYFAAAGDDGSGVYGQASGFYGKGVYGDATGYFGRGVYGSATGTSGKGVYGYAYGTSGRGVYGYASNSGIVTNYGGYFEAKGTFGKGVYGSTSGAYGEGVYGRSYGASGMGVYGYADNSGNFTNYGGYFVAGGTSGRGVSGIADGTSGRGVYGKAAGSSGKGVYGYGGEYDFYAAGPGTNYGAFTGAHEVKFAEDTPGEIVPGMIVSVTGKTETRKDKNGEISLSSTLPTVTLSTRAGDKAVFGVIVSDGPLHEEHWYETQEGERFGVVNALGEGRVWVTDFNGDIQAGDYITTSSVPGYGQMQDDDLLHSYTLGKAIETIDWEQVTKTVQHEGKAYKRYLIAVVYTSG